MNANRLQSAAPTNGSRTITLTTTSAPSGTGSHSDVDSNSRPPDGVLRLRGGPRRRDGPRVTWGEEVVDNEGCGKKKSKICCIYHKPRPYDESSDESDQEGSSEDPAKPSHSHHKHDSAHDNAYERQPQNSNPHEGGKS